MVHGISSMLPTCDARRAWRVYNGTLRQLPATRCAAAR